MPVSGRSLPCLVTGAIGQKQALESLWLTGWSHLIGDIAFVKLEAIKNPPKRA
jgi:hypothetical protein